jgi:ABC-type multidrug transport system fused ATPase/permease subunit
MIAHRLSTVRHADLILLMEDGAIVERGTHDALMDARGAYYDMVTRQLRSAADQSEAVLR